MVARSSKPSETVLLVDDEPRLLAGLKRQLRKGFQIDTAVGPEEGLRALRERGPYAVIVSDMRMPGMNGVEFLSVARKVSPHSVRLMLTGDADQQTATAAINQGSIFRFLNKPCSPETLSATLTEAIHQYRLEMAEKELLEQTLRGSVKVLTDVLSLVNPTAFGRAGRVRRLVRKLLAQHPVDKRWQIELAAMLSQLGCVAIPEQTLQRAFNCEDLMPAERDMLREHPETARNLLAHIPRMEPVAEIVAYQQVRFDGKDAPPKTPHGRSLPIGARMLKIVLDYDTLHTQGLDADEALAVMRGRTGCYDPELLEDFAKVAGATSQRRIERLPVAQLGPHMTLAEDVRLANGTVLLARGQEVSPPLKARLANFVARGLVQEPIAVVIDASEHATGA